MNTRRRLLAACVCALLAGCGDAAGQTSPPAPSADSQATSLAFPSSSASGAAPPPATARPTPRPRPSALELDFQTIDQRFTTPLLAAATTGAELIWSSGALDGPAVETAPDLYRFQPGVDAEPRLLWQNARRAAVVEPIDGDGVSYAFADYGTTPGDFWRLWLLPSADAAPILLDDGNDGPDVPSFIPSFDLSGGRLVWTAFHSGANGPESQLWEASAPEWTPRLIRAVLAAERELWLPSLRGTGVAFVEVTYSADRSTDKRHVLLLDLDEPSGQPTQLDTSGRATMPILLEDAVIWKETAPGFNMFNWGTLVEHSLRTGETERLNMSPQQTVNYPSAGNRFVAAWGFDSTAFAVHDLEQDTSRSIVRYDPSGTDSIVRPHVAGNMIVAIHGVSNPDGTQAGPLELWWARLPEPREER